MIDNQIGKLTPAALAQAFPTNLRVQAEKSCKSLFRNSVPGSKDWRSCFSVNVADEQIIVPSRVYFETIPMSFNLLKGDEKLIQECIWTRHHIGYKRQSALAEIIPANRAWTIPFVVFLVGEYVIEILDVIFDRIDEIDDKKLAEFLAKNPKFHLLTRERVVSYWDVYYRRDIRRGDYVGFKILSHFQKVLIAHNPELGGKKVWKRFSC